MFPQESEFKYEEKLIEYFKLVEKKLFSKSSISQIKYKHKKFNSTNENLNLDISENHVLLNDVKGKGGVYAIFSDEKSKNYWTLKYIGQTKGKYSRQRIINHLFGKNKKTGAQLDRVIKAVKNGENLAISFVVISPEELRTYVEEKLIKTYEYYLEWNKQGR